MPSQLVTAQFFMARFQRKCEARICEVHPPCSTGEYVDPFGGIGGYALNVEFWTSELQGVANAPALFGLALFAVGIGIWRGVNWAYGKHIDGLEAEKAALQQLIKLHLEQIAKLKSENSGRRKRSLSR
jgi:hypothetical protein